MEDDDATGDHDDGGDHDHGEGIAPGQVDEEAAEAWIRQRIEPRA